MEVPDEGENFTKVRQLHPGKSRQGNFIYKALFIHEADSKFFT